jgi:hypothetical protein
MNISVEIDEYEVLENATTEQLKRELQTRGEYDEDHVVGPDDSIEEKVNEIRYILGLSEFADYDQIIEELSYLFRYPGT